DLRATSTLAVRVQVGELHRRLERASSELYAVLLELDGHHRALGDRQRHLLLIRGLCLRAAGIHRQEHMVRADDDDADDPLSCRAHSAVHPVSEPWLGEYLPAADRAEIPGRGGLLHLPHGTILQAVAAR